jgi:magnesium transporter
MMQAFGVHDGRLARLDLTLADFPTTSGLLWIDLSNPSRDEETWVENTLRVQVPTRQEMAEIEESARLYEERGALVMTAVVINGVAEGRPSRTQVTFVLTKTHLVSVRYADPLPFRTFDAKCQRQADVLTSSDRILVSLLESIVERAADVLEMLAADLNEVSNIGSSSRMRRRADAARQSGSRTSSRCSSSASDARTLWFRSCAKVFCRSRG